MRKPLKKICLAALMVGQVAQQGKVVFQNKKKYIYLSHIVKDFQQIEVNWRNLSSLTSFTSESNFRI